MTKFKIRFDALRNAHYHRSRQRVLDWLNRFTNFLVIMLGAGVASELIGAAAHHERTVYLGLATTFVGTLQLVFDPGGRARTHEFLQRRFYEVLALVEEASDEPAAEQIRLWEASLIRIYADEPPTMRALDSIAYNETGDALGLYKGDLIKVGFFASLFRHVVAFNSKHFETINEWRLRKGLPAVPTTGAVS